MTGCRGKHHLTRVDECLGMQRPYSHWTEASGSPVDQMPSFVWKGFFRYQKNRIYDLVDIQHLRYARHSQVDTRFKTLVWNVSQNEDRQGSHHSMRGAGIITCCTPDGENFISNQGRLVTGLEVQGLQGIPHGRLLLNKECESDLRDLARRNMSNA